MCYALIWDPMVQDRVEFFKESFRKRFYSRIVKYSLGFYLSFVSMTDVNCKLGWFFLVLRVCDENPIFSVGSVFKRICLK